MQVSQVLALGGILCQGQKARSEQVGAHEVPDVQVRWKQPPECGLALPNKQTRTLIVSIECSSDECLEWLWRELYSADGANAWCHRCAEIRRHHRISGRRAYACDKCGMHVFPTRGTLFANSSTGLHKWFRAIALLVDTDGKLPAKRLAYELDLSYRTALRMRSRILSKWREEGAQTHLINRISNIMKVRSDTGLRMRERDSHSRSIDRTRYRILNAACQIFSRHGLANARMSDIAIQSGVSVGCVYQHFGRKELLLAAALDWSNVKDDVEILRIQQTTASPVETMRQILVFSCNGSESESRSPYRLWLEVWAASGRHPELVRTCADESMRWERFLCDLIEDGAKAGAFFPIASAEETAKRITSMLTGLALKRTVGYSQWTRDSACEVLLRFAAEQLGVAQDALFSAPTARSRRVWRNGR